MPTEHERLVVERREAVRATLLANQATYRKALDAFLDAVEAAKNDPDHPLSYAESARLAGMSEQNLQRLRDTRKARQAPAEQATG